MPYCNRVPLFFDDAQPLGQWVIVTHEELEAIQRVERRQRDRMFQAMNNNLWDNNPDEIDRWENEGGK